MACLCVPIDRRKGEFQADNSSSGTAVQLGGTWLPTTCIARQRVAVIIPFRDRGRHLTTLLPVLHSLMQAQQLHYTVYVVEQVRSRLVVVVVVVVLLVVVTASVLWNMLWMQQLHYAVYVIKGYIVG